MPMQYNDSSDNEEDITKTFHGYVESFEDALLIFHAVDQGLLNKVKHRTKHQDVIKSGSIFVYDKTSELKRWTDGLKWSPSRISDNFLIYKELTIKYSKRKRQKIVHDQSDSKKTIDSKGSYIFKDDGLVKRTVTSEINGRVMHLVAYHQESEVERGRLVPVSSSYLVSRVSLPTGITVPTLMDCEEKRSRSSSTASLSSSGETDNSSFTFPTPVTNTIDFASVDPFLDVSLFPPFTQGLAPIPNQDTQEIKPSFDTMKNFEAMNIIDTPFAPFVSFSINGGTIWPWSDETILTPTSTLSFEEMFLNCDDGKGLNEEEEDSCDWIDDFLLKEKLQEKMH